MKPAAQAGRLARPGLEPGSPLAKGQRRVRADGLRIGDSEREARALPLDVFGPRGELALVREHEGSLDPQLRHEEGYIEDAAPAHFGVGAAADGQRARKEVPQHDALARSLALHPTLDRRHGEDGPDQLLGATPGLRDFRHGGVLCQAPFADGAVDESHWDLQQQHQERGADHAIEDRIANARECAPGGCEEGVHGDRQCRRDARAAPAAGPSEAGGAAFDDLQNVDVLPFRPAPWEVEEVAMATAERLYQSVDGTRAALSDLSTREAGR